MASQPSGSWTPSIKRGHKVFSYRLIDGCFYKNLEIHVSSSWSNKQKHSASKQTKMFLFWLHHHTKGINLIIGHRWMLPQKPWNSCLQLKKQKKLPNFDLFPIIQGLYNKHQHGYRLNDGSFQENLAIHFSNSSLKRIFKHCHSNFNIINCKEFGL